MTISEGEAAALATPTAVPREAAEKVLRYLVFHRSLIGETEDTSALLERYLTLVENLKDGVHLVIPDPFQKAMALLFELVMEEEFDPWEIDLVKFTESYLERVRSDGAVNFSIAGRLVYMAWSILYLQSEELLKVRDLPAAAPGDAAEADPVDGSYLPLMETPEAVDVTSTILGSLDAPPLLEMVRHPETRPVSLLELVHAFGEAEVDARRAVRIQELRERLREEQRSPPEVLVHGDLPEHDLVDTWAAALRHPVNAPFPLLDLWRPLSGRDHLVAIFLAALFLARERSIDLRQEVLGEGPVLIVRLSDTRRVLAEEA
ncbi:MAG: segregation/condensation protein A [Thermoplasmata archaeon]